MKLLLDTSILLWLLSDPGKLSSSARSLLDDLQNELFFSAISIWEIAVKQRQNRADFRAEAVVIHQELRRLGFAELLLSSEHGIATLALPMLHKDPFDRILIAQATVEGLTLLTSDAIAASYPGPILKV